MLDRARPLTGPAHLSVSQLTCFAGCPRKYRYRYLDKLAPAFRPAALAVGTAWHHTVGVLLETPATPREELETVLRDALLAELEADGPPVLFDDETSVDAVVDRCIAMLHVFMSEAPRPERVLGVELVFSAELVSDQGEVVPLPLIGSLDALVELNGKVVVLELKTSKRRWTADQLEFDLQPTAYRIGARSLGQDAEVVLLATTKTKRPQLQLEPFTRTAQDEADLVSTALGVVAAVEAGVDYPLRGWQCRGCGYAGVCR